MSERPANPASTILAVLSLVLCVTAGGCWVRSYLGDTWRVGSIRGGFAFASIGAGESFMKQIFGDSGSHTILRSLYHSSNARQELLGFTYVSGGFSGMTYWLVAVPYWFIVLLTAIVPVRWWIAQRRSRRRDVEGRCPGCGYDLRATPEQCPECGWNKAPAA